MTGIELIVFALGPSIAASLGVLAVWPKSKSA